jgi:hypothetical protein
VFKELVEIDERRKAKAFENRTRPDSALEEVNMTTITGGPSQSSRL